MITQIKKTFQVSHEKSWYETYWAFDFHGTIIKPTYDLNDRSLDYYPYAKRTMQMLSAREDIVLISWTSSYPHEIDEYLKKFEEDGIKFDHKQCNPGISSNMGNFGYYETKFYFNVLFEDKAGFQSDEEWEEIHEYLKWCEKTNYLPDPRWTAKY
ncbi:MAG: hypothetical protein HC831_16285 [Chloroflexia bacterium]|nr:hypothetical protein [Chloroflexia bacterium]